MLNTALSCAGLSEWTAKTGSRKRYPGSRGVSPALPKGKENLSAQPPRERDVPAGRAGGRTAEAPQYAAEAHINTKTATYPEPIPSFRFAASITAFILASLSDSSDGPADISQSALNSSPNSMCCTTGF